MIHRGGERVGDDDPRGSGGEHGRSPRPAQGSNRPAALVGVDGAVRRPPPPGRCRRSTRSTGARWPATTCGRRSSWTSCIAAFVVARPRSSSAPRRPGGGRPSPASSSCSWSPLGRGYDRKTLGDGPVEFQAVLRAGVGSAAIVALGSVALADAAAADPGRRRRSSLLTIAHRGRAAPAAPVAAPSPQPRDRDVPDARRRRRHVGPPPHPRPARCDLPRLPGGRRVPAGDHRPPAAGRRPDAGCARRHPAGRLRPPGRRRHRLGQRAVGRRAAPPVVGARPGRCRPRRRSRARRGARAARAPAADRRPVAARGRDLVARGAGCSPSPRWTARSAPRSSWRPRRSSPSRRSPCG